MNDSTTPTEIPSRTVLAMMSETTTMAAPRIIDPGIRNLLSGPMTILAMCGTTSPTNPSTPVTETYSAIMNDMTRRHRFLNLSASRPSPLAPSSPREIMLSCLDTARKNTDPAAVTTAIRGILSDTT